MDNASLKAQVASFARATEPFRSASVPAATFQLITTLGLYVATVALMMFGVWNQHWMVLFLAPLGGGLMIRLFIIQHDCGHSSFLPSKGWNDAVGRMLSVLTFTPYEVWKREHAAHHAGSSHLERRGVGDIDLLTVREYLALSKVRRVQYRALRNPLFLILIGGPIYFFVLNRFPWGRGFPAREVWRSTVGLDIALVFVYGVLSAAMGYEIVLSVFGPVAYIASGIGVWLFYIQHQFESVQWYDKSSWDFQVASVYGSSYYKLPRILAWFTGDIGIHPLHHLSSKIPNYKLRSCLKVIPGLETLNLLTFRESLRCASLKLWDEEKSCLAGYP